MNFHDFIKNVKERGINSYFSPSKRNSYHRFEKLIIKLISIYCENLNKLFIPNIYIGHGDESFLADGFVHEGIDELNGPTVIEIKLALPDKELIQLVAARLVKSDPKIQSFLLITGAKLTKTATETIERQVKKITDIQFKVWDSNQIINLIQQYAEFISDMIPEITELAVDNVVRKSVDVKPEEWKKERDKHLESLRQALINNDLTLFLGAGVSLKAGVPDWKSLVSSLLVELIGKKLPETLNTSDEEKKIIANYIQDIHGASPLLETRYIRNGLGEEFERTVSKYLYEKIGENAGTSKTLETIAKVCIPPRDGLGIRAIITYNFDDLVEKNLETLGIRNRSIYRDNDIASQNEIAVYHVHGFLPRNVEQYDGLTESLLIFSEEGYHTVFLEPYSWSNLVQLNYLRESTCLLVGLSVTDPNLRRLLDIAAKKGKPAKHYVFQKRSGPIKSVSMTAIRDDVSQTFMSVHHQLQETSFNELGLNIIWIEDYEKDIPQILNDLRQ